MLLLQPLLDLPRRIGKIHILKRIKRKLLIKLHHTFINLKVARLTNLVFYCVFFNVLINLAHRALMPDGIVVLLNY